MNDQIFFSIICPTFNALPHLKKLLESLTIQTFKRFELIVLDNLSNDGTLELCKSFESILNMRIVSEKDTGIYDAFNRGIKQAQGSYLYFIGADDYLASDKVLSEIFERTKRQPHILYGNVKVGDNALHGSIDSNYLAAHNFPHQAAFFKKEVFELLGNYKTEYKIESDYEFMLRAFNDPKIHIEYIDIIIAQYGHEGVSTQKFDLKFALDAEEIFFQAFKNKAVRIPPRYYINLLKAGYKKEALSLIFKSKFRLKHIIKALILLILPMRKA